MAQEQKRILKLTVGFHRAENVTSEAFHTHWTDKHGPLAAAVMARNGVLGYKQYHTPPSIRSTFAIPNANWEMTTCDGYAEIYLEKLDDLKKVMTDSEWIEVVNKDGEGWFGPKQTVTVGWEVVFVQDGKAVVR